MRQPYSSRKRPRLTLSISFEPFHLSQEEDDERIQRLSSKVLDCIAEARGARKRGRPRGKPEVELEQFFESEVDRVLRQP